MTKLPKPDSPATEGQTQRLILDWLAAKGYFALRMNTGAMVSEYKGKKRFMRFGVPGCADILVFDDQWIDQGLGHGHIKHGPCIWIEVKAPKGKQTDLQKSFQAQVESRAHRYIVAYSLEDVENALK